MISSSLNIIASLPLPLVVFVGNRGILCWHQMTRRILFFPVIMLFIFWCGAMQSLALEKLKLVVNVGDDASARDASNASVCQFLVEGSLLHGARWDGAAKSLCYGGSEASPLPPLSFRWCL